MLEIETGTKPDLTVLDNTTQIPDIKTGSKSLDLTIERAWFEKYESAIDMLGDIEALLGSNSLAAGSLLDTAAIESLQAEITDWRRIRAWKYGKIPFRTRNYPTLADTSIQVKSYTACVRRKESKF